MSRLPVTETSRRIKFTKVYKLLKTERNRLKSWDSATQELITSIPANQSPRNAITPKTLNLVSKIFKLIFASLFKLTYILFKLVYEIAKIVTRGLSIIRRLLFVAR